MFGGVSAPRESPPPTAAAQRAGSPRMPRPARPMSPTSPDSPPPACTGAPPCLPERQAARQAGPSHAWGPLAAHPHPRAHASLPGLLAYVRGPALADGLAAQGAARIHCQTRGAQHLGPPRPRLRRGRYDRPACHFTSPERPPPAGTEEPATRGGLGMRARKAGAGACLPYFAAAWRRATLAFMHSTTPTARTPTIAVTQAAKSLKCRAGIPMSRPTT